MLASDPTSALIRFRVAIAHQSLGESYMAMASDNRRPAAQRQQFWTEALSWLEKAYKVDRELRDNGTLTGDEAERVDIVTAKIAECKAALKKSLSARPPWGNADS